MGTLTQRPSERDVTGLFGGDDDCEVPSAPSEDGEALLVGRKRPLSPPSALHRQQLQQPLAGIIGAPGPFRILTLCVLAIASACLAVAPFRYASDTVSAVRASGVPHDLILGFDARPSKMYLVVTASIQPNNRNANPLRDTNSGERNVDKRQLQYERGIGRLKMQAELADLPLPFEIVVVENNGLRKTFLDDLGVTVLYTDGNAVDQEKGLKELDDIMAAVKHYQMSDADLVVKMTGRYFLDDDRGGLAPFMAILRDVDVDRTRAIVKFGTYARPVNRRVVDCVTGLIMVPVAVLLNIDRSIVPIAPSWARSVLSLPEDEVIAVQGKMGIHIAPAGKPYYIV